MPRYHLQLIRVRSIRSEELDKVLYNERRALALMVTVILACINMLRYTQIYMFFLGFLLAKGVRHAGRPDCGGLVLGCIEADFSE